MRARVELDPLEEDAGFGVDVLLGVQDVAAHGEHELGHRVDESGLVGTGQQEDDTHRVNVGDQ